MALVYHIKKDISIQIVKSKLYTNIKLEIL